MTDIVEMYRHLGRNNAEREKTLRHAFQRGYEDFDTLERGNGDDADACNPYPPQSPEAAEWRRGWNTRNWELAK